MRPIAHQWVSGSERSAEIGHISALDSFWMRDPPDAKPPPRPISNGPTAAHAVPDAAPGRLYGRGRPRRMEEPGDLDGRTRLLDGDALGGQAALAGDSAVY